MNYASLQHYGTARCGTGVQAPPFCVYPSRPLFGDEPPRPIKLCSGIPLVSTTFRPTDPLAEFRPMMRGRQQ